MKKIIIFLIGIISLCSCGSIEYNDWETNISYDVISGNDTIHVEKTDTVAYNTRYKPCVSVNTDSTMIVVRFIDNKGEIPSYEHHWSHKGELKNIIKYNHNISGTKLQLVSFEAHVIRCKKVSGFDGKEIKPDTTMIYVPVI